jgi:hypothetical protein
MSTFLFIILFGFLLKAYTSLHLTNKILFYFPQKKSRFVQIFTILVMLQCLYEQKNNNILTFCGVTCMYIFHFGMQKTFWVKLENLLKVLSQKKKRQQLLKIYNFLSIFRKSCFWKRKCFILVI